MAGNEDPRGHAADLLGRALAALPAAARAGLILLRADAGYFAGALARAALSAGVEFAIGAKRIAPLWRILDGVAESDWTDAIDMDGAQVAVAQYCPDWWYDEGYRKVEIAAMSGASRPTVDKWLARYERFGLEGLVSMTSPAQQVSTIAGQRPRLVGRSSIPGCMCWMSAWGWCRRVWWVSCMWRGRGWRGVICTDPV